MATVNVADLVARLSLNTRDYDEAVKDLDKDFAKALGKIDAGVKKLEDSLEKVPPKIRRSFADLQKTLKDFGSSMESTGRELTKSLTLPIAAVGAAAFAAANAVDEALDDIRAATGATGAALDGLARDFRTVFENVPASSTQVAQAIGQLNTRLGLAGEPLQALSTQILHLARLTKTEVPAAVDLSAQAFVAWGITVERQADALDFLFRVTQQTGVGFSQLAGTIVQAGPLLRQLGFTFEETAALIGQLDKAGVNAQTSMFALRTAIVRLQDAGVQDIAAGLQAVFEQVKSAKSDADALGVSLEFFGTRAGPAFTDAIRQGRLDLDALMTTLRASSETIGKAAKDTESFAEKFVLLKNRVTLALEPIGRVMIKVFEADAFPAITKALGSLKDLAESFEALPEPVRKLGLAFVAFVAVAGPALAILGAMTTAIAALNPWVALLVITLGAAGAAWLAFSGNAKASAATIEELNKRVPGLGDRLADLERQIEKTIDPEKRKELEKMAEALRNLPPSTGLPTGPVTLGTPQFPFPAAGGPTGPERKPTLTNLISKEDRDALAEYERAWRSLASELFVPDETARRLQQINAETERLVAQHPKIAEGLRAIGRGMFDLVAAAGAAAKMAEIPPEILAMDEAMLASADAATRFSGGLVETMARLGTWDQAMLDAAARTAEMQTGIRDAVERLQTWDDAMVASAAAAQTFKGGLVETMAELEKWDEALVASAQLYEDNFRPLREYEAGLKRVADAARLTEPAVSTLGAQIAYLQQQITAALASGSDVGSERITALVAKLRELQGLRDVATVVTDVFGAIDRAITTSVDGIIQGTTTLREAFENMGQSIVLSITNMIINRGLKALERAIVEFMLSEKVQQFIRSFGSAIFGGGVSEGTVIQSGFGAGTQTVGQAAVTMQHGGMVRARPGGTHALLAEAGDDEVVTPLNRQGARALWAALEDVAGSGGGARSGPAVEVNVINNSGEKVEHREQRKPDGRTVHQIIIGEIVAAADSGELDRVLGRNFGTARTGVAR